MISSRQATEDFLRGAAGLVEGDAKPPRLAVVLWLALCPVAVAFAFVSPDVLAAPDGADIERKDGGKAVPTYCKDVVPILQKHCLECHRKGQVGPFRLETYEQARKRASDIASVIKDRVMPPWKPAPHFGVTLSGDKSLSDLEIATILRWADAGAPLGNRADLPATRCFPDGWAFGTPDLILDIGADFPVPAAGEDVIRCFVVPINLPSDVYVSGIHYRPGNPRVVHHVTSLVATAGEGRRREASDLLPGYPCFAGPAVDATGELGAWGPGAEPLRLPDGFGKALPKKADIIVQIHYHPSGKPETDRTQVGLYFARKPVKRTLQRAAAWNPNLVLRADGPVSSRIEAKASWTIPVDVVAFACAPHMHQLGRDMLMSVHFPDGRKQDLIRIDDWDFNWQFGYRFALPLVLPKGTVLEVVAHYDNTANNPHNPNKPPKVVAWGTATTDEMCIGFIVLAKKNQDLTRPGEKDDLFELIKESGGWPIFKNKPTR
jgi:hypothetical protein